MKTLHLSELMARWLSFFSEYKFHVLYKPGMTNKLADALSRRPDDELQTALSRQVTDDDNKDDRYVSLNLTTLRS